MKPKEFIKLIDYNSQQMNVKGGCVMNRFKLIIITSIIRPADIYRGVYDEEAREQWMRRMQVIDLWPKRTDKNNDDPFDGFMD